MLTLDRPQDANLKERGVARGVRVRVRPNGPLVDLPLGKTTIGSSPRCNIRIQQPGVQPLHCLILRDADGLSVRRWAGETVLNGQRLEESSICPGDCLQVGPVELEFVLPQAAITPSPITGTLPAMPTVAPDPAPSPMAAAPTPSSLSKPEQAKFSRLHASRDLALSRTRQMLATLRKRREADRELRSRVVDLEQQLERAATDREDVVGQLQNVMSELESARGQIAEQQAVSATNQELAEQAVELTNRVSQLHSEVKDLAQERAALAVEQAVTNQEREALRQQLQAAAEEVAMSAGERDKLVAECERLREQSDRLPQLEQKIRDVVADRENTSSELYRALLQLAEMQERDDHNVALAAAHAALDAELVKSMQDIAALQSQIDRLGAERIAADEMRQTPDRQTAELIEAHQQLAYDKNALNAELAEFREQLEAARRQEAESAARIETAEALRQRLEENERNQSELAETVARLQSELDRKERTGADAAIAIADRERQIAEYARLLDESGAAFRLLEKKLTESGDSEVQFDRLRGEWQREREEAVSQQLRLTQQITDLESKLADAQAPSSGTNATEVDKDPSVENAISRDPNGSPETGCHAAAAEGHVGDDNTPPVAELPSESAGLTTCSESQVESNSESDAEPLAETALKLLESKIGWRQASEKPAEEAASDCNSATSFKTSSSELANERVEECGSTVSSNESPTGEAVQKPSKMQPESYIDRFSHMFAEGGAASEPQTAPTVASPRVDQNSSRKPPSGGGVRSSGDSSLTARAEDEESIEDYMAKLLQRVRGELPASGAASSAAPVKPAEQITAPTDFSLAPLTAPPSMASDLPSPMGFDPRKRRPSMPAPKTDLEALRALANESARRAISRHASRKHRRAAVTKVIVSTLAGMTSLWLMLDSENWLNLQFITACLAMLIAAYWGGETLRALLESHRDAAKDEIDVEIEELAAELRTPLPIDVE